MLGLLVFSLAVSAPMAGAQTAPTRSQQSFALRQPDEQVLVVEQPATPIDDMESRPGSDVCYKIRAYIFSKGRNPRFLRETTCGPIAPNTKKIDGKPGFMPLDLKARPEAAPEQ